MNQVAYQAILERLGVERDASLKREDKDTETLAKPAQDWLRAWQEIARLTNRVTREDRQLGPIMQAVEQCDVAFLAGDWLGFQRAAEQVRLAVQMEHER